MSEKDQNPRMQTEGRKKGAADPRADDRRSPVNPTQNPMPSSPVADEEAVRKGEETLERVKPY